MLRIFTVRSTTTDRTFLPFCPKVILLSVCWSKNLGKWNILFKNHIQMKFKKKIWQALNIIILGSPTIFFNSKKYIFNLYYTKKNLKKSNLSNYIHISPSKVLLVQYIQKMQLTYNNVTIFTVIFITD